MTSWTMNQEEKEISFVYKGQEAIVKYRGLPWSKKNQIISKCTSYNSDGELHFNLDMYNKECLMYMIVSAPWGKTDQTFLTSIDDELGMQLQKVCPKYLEAPEDVNFFEGESKDS